MWPDGAKYEGRWKNNMLDGKGRFEYANGDMYNGDWSKNKACGKGKYLHANGA